MIKYKKRHNAPETQDVASEYEAEIHTVSVTKYWDSFVTEAMESPSLEILKSCLNMALGSPA